jgi:MerR family regulatory protein
MELLSIGRFFRLSGLSVKALRHYDEIGLLPPEAVDAETSSRSSISRSYEAMARAHALAGNEVEAREWFARARTAAADVADEDDRAILEADLASIFPS